jgi:hypothetical protein
MIFFIDHRWITETLDDACEWLFSGVSTDLPHHVRINKAKKNHDGNGWIIKSDESFETYLSIVCNAKLVRLSEFNLTQLHLDGITYIDK